MNDTERREQAISFVYGNTRMSNPDVTRQMVEEIYDAMARMDAKRNITPGTYVLYRGRKDHYWFVDYLNEEKTRVWLRWLSGNPFVPYTAMADLSEVELY